MGDLENYHQQLINQSIKLSSAIVHLVQKQSNVYFTGRISNLFLSLDAALDRDERLVEQYGDKIAELEYLHKRVEDEIDRVEQQLKARAA